MSLAQGNNTPTRPRIEPGSPDPESDALTTRPVCPPPPPKKKYCAQTIVPYVLDSKHRPLWSTNGLVQLKRSGVDFELGLNSLIKNCPTANYMYVLLFLYYLFL